MYRMCREGDNFPLAVMADTSAFFLILKPFERLFDTHVLNLDPHGKLASQPRSLAGEVRFILWGYPFGA
jgi:hypothetical protein